MKTKNTYCGDGWDFEITTDDADWETPTIHLSMKRRDQPINRWELEELADFLKEFLLSSRKVTQPSRKVTQQNQDVPPMRERHTCC